MKGILILLGIVGFSLGFIGGWSALKLAFIVTLIFIGPTYIFVKGAFPDLKNKLLVSFPVSLGLIPSLTYPLSFLMGIKIGAIASAGFLIALGLAMQHPDFTNRFRGDPNGRQN